ncbi:hypothetical protein TNCV_3278771 [Trichonephila clavipes]|nr:hypothetical protein TNCV_3278771 [Trichonephila clavipes]
MTQQTAPWENWHLKWGSELLMTFGLVRWGLGGSGHVEDSPVTISPHKTLNSCRGVISESDLLTTPDAEILDGFSDQGVIQLSQTYAQATKPSPISVTTQIDENITKIKCPPLNLLPPLSSPPKPNISLYSPAASKLSSSQTQLLPSISSIAPTVSHPQPPTLVCLIQKNNHLRHMAPERIVKRRT